MLVAIGVGTDGFREILGVAEGTKEDSASWLAFVRSLKERGLKGVRLITSDKCLGLLEAIGSCFPETRWQRCIVHFYRNVFSLVPSGKVREVAAMLKAIHAQEDRAAADAKVQVVEAKLRAMKLGKAADLVRDGTPETLTYYPAFLTSFVARSCQGLAGKAWRSMPPEAGQRPVEDGIGRNNAASRGLARPQQELVRNAGYAFPGEHRRRIRTNNPMERIMREIRRRTRVVGCFPDGSSALMLVAARLRHIAGTKWGTRRYLDMKHLHDADAASATAVANAS